MKKLIRKLIAFPLLVLLIIFSCSDEKPDKVNSLDLEALLQKMTYDPSFKIIKGNFEVWKTENNEIALFNKDGDNTNFFILQGAEALTSLKSGYLEILYLKFGIVVKSNEKNYYLNVNNPGEDSYIQVLDFKKETVSGFGLIYNTYPLFSLDELKKQQSLESFFSRL